MAGARRSIEWAGPAAGGWADFFGQALLEGFGMVDVLLPPPARRLRRGYLAFLLGGGLLAACVYGLAPRWRAVLVEEDGVLESLSAVCFGLAFLAGCLAWKVRPGGRAPRRGAAVIPALGLLGFLDETSFCGLLAGSDNPASSGAGAASSPLVLPGGYILDGVHDLFTLPFKVWRDHAGFWGYAVGSVLLGLAVGLLVAKRRLYMPWVMSRVWAYLPYDFLRYAVILVGVAQLVDLDLLPGPWGLFLEEGLEAGGAWSLGCAALAMALVPAPEAFAGPAATGEGSGKGLDSTPPSG